MRRKRLTLFAAASIATLLCAVAMSEKMVVVADYSCITAREIVMDEPALPVPEPAPLPTPTPMPTPTPAPDPASDPTEDPYTTEELETLAIIIYQEAGGDYCSDSTRQMVGEVFLNRVADSRFPDSFEEVATAKAQYGRLHWTGLIWPERASNLGEVHAVQRAYDCAEALLSGAVERLLPLDTVWQAEFMQGTETVIEQDGFYFCR